MGNKKDNKGWKYTSPVTWLLCHNVPKNDCFSEEES